MVELRTQTGGNTASGIEVPAHRCELSQDVCALGASQGAKAAAHGYSWPSAPSQKGFLI